MKIHKKFFSNFRSILFIITIISLFFFFYLIYPRNLVYANLEFDVITSVVGSVGSTTQFSYGLTTGDVNGDGYQDLIVPETSYSTYTGRLYIFFGGETIDNGVDVVITGEGTYTYFPNFTFDMSVMDIDNDGFDDIIAGANLYGYPNPTGRAYIFYGRSDWPQNLSASDADIIILGNSDTKKLLGTTCNSGDFNGDGYLDLSFGASAFNNNQGTIVIYWGDGTKNFNTTEDKIITIAGSDHLGWGSHKSGDINNDGYDDLLFEEWYAWQSKVYILYGGQDMNTTYTPENGNVKFIGESTSDRMTRAASDIKDIDNDGYDDVCLGAYTNSSVASYAGRVYCFWGSNSLSGDKNVGTDADFILPTAENATANDNFGRAVFLSDINNDGNMDLIAGAYQTNGTHNGYAEIYLGNGTKNFDMTADLRINAADIGESGKYFGHQIKAGDMDNDGWPNLYIASAQGGNGSGDTGRVYIFEVNHGSPSLSLDQVSLTNDSTPDLTGIAIDSGVNVGGVQWSLSNTVNGSWNDCSVVDGTFDSESEAFSCSISNLSDGTHTIYFRSHDVDNVYIPSTLYATDDFIADTTGPTGTISINSDEEITNTDEVILTLSATDNLTEVKKMMVSNKVDYSGGTWETYNTSKEWRLSMGDGEKRVYVKYRDEVGNISSSNSDSIEMDMGAPTGTLIINEGEEYTSSREVVLHITGEDEVTGVEEMRISEERTMEGVEWEGYETSREYTLSEGDGYKVIYIQYRDGIGNESEVYGSNITLDRNTEIDITEIGEEEVEGEIENWETEDTTPTFTGEGEVGATITIEIEGIETGTVVVNEDGKWSWTPSIELTRGQEYNVTITSTDLAGNEDIQTFILGIADEEVIEVNQTTPEAQITTTQLPNTGVILIIGLMVIGGLLWTGMNFKVIEKLRKR